MSFLSKFSIDGQQYTVLECSYAFNQPMDSSGNIKGRPKGGQIDLIIESRGDTSLLNWMLSETQVKEGTITFFKRDAMAKLLEIEFSEAFCVSYREQFFSASIKPMQISITISAEKLKIGDQNFMNYWKAKN
jgi:hypothetical protein